MSLVTRRALLTSPTPLILAKRFRGKINIQRPRQPHYERAKYIALTQPFFKKSEKKLLQICGNHEVKSKGNEENPYLNILAQELLHTLKTSKLVGFFHENPISGEEKYKAYVMCHKQNMLLKSYGKKLVEKAVTNTPYCTILDFYCSHNAMVFSPNIDIKNLLKVQKKFPQLILLAGIVENKLVGVNELIELSKIPDLKTAQCGLVQTLNTIGSQLVAHLTNRQTTLVSQLEERIKQLEVKT